MQDPEEWLKVTPVRVKLLNIRMRWT